MNASSPTPGDVYGSRRFFDWRPVRLGDAGNVAQRRARTLATARDQVTRLATALAALGANDESDLDLNLERYRRVAARTDDALDAFDSALAAGPPPPALAPHDV